MSNYDDLSKRLATGTDPIGIKGIKPISGKFKAKKCVKTVSYRGRPRYICPASGGESAIRSLEKLPVKPEDVPQRLADIKQFSPEEQYTPKQQREEPAKIHEALFRKPVNIHTKDVEEAGPDAMHDHLHFHEPEEATEQDSDAIILKEDKKKKKSSKKGDDMDKGIYLRLDLFKGPPTLKTGPRPPKSTSVKWVFKRQGKAPSPPKVSDTPTKAASPPPSSIEYKVVSARQEIPKRFRGTHGLAGKTHQSGFKITNDPKTRLFKTKDDADAALARVRKLKVVKLPSGKFGVKKDPNTKTFDSRDKARAHRFKVVDTMRPDVSVATKVLGKQQPGRLPPTPRSKTLGEHLKYAGVNTALTIIPIGKVGQVFKWLATGSKSALKAVQPAIKAAGGTMKITPKGAVVTGGAPVKNVLTRGSGIGGAARGGSSGGAAVISSKAPGAAKAVVEQLAPHVVGISAGLGIGGAIIGASGDTTRDASIPAVGSPSTVAGSNITAQSGAGVTTTSASRAKAKAKAKAEARTRRAQRGNRRRWRIPFPGDEDPKKKKEKGKKPRTGDRDQAVEDKGLGDIKKEFAADTLEEAKRRHKRYVDSGQYSEIGIEGRREIEHIIDRMEARSKFHKSQAFIAPYARQVRSKKMSLKDALDKVPWWMQDELLAHLRKKKKRR